MNPLFYRFCQSVLFVIFKLWNRFTIHGKENLPRSGQGFVLAANHVSYLDPPVLGGRVSRPLVFLAKERLFKIKVLKQVITWLGALPIAGDSDFRSLRTVIRSLKEKHAVVIFPEGTRSDGEEFLKPQAGVGFLAHAAGVPIIPCYISGTQRAWPRGKKIFRPAKIQVFIGKPIEIGDCPQGIEKNVFYEEFATTVMRSLENLKSLATGHERKK